MRSRCSVHFAMAAALRCLEMAFDDWDLESALRWFGIRCWPSVEHCCSKRIRAVRQCSLLFRLMYRVASYNVLALGISGGVCAIVRCEPSEFQLSSSRKGYLPKLICLFSVPRRFF